MYCINCGSQLSDDANYCLKCGKPQKPNIQVDEVKWETCEIVYEEINRGGVFSNSQMRFWADAIGQKGSYNAGASISFEQYVYPPASDDQRALNAHRDLIKQLIADGWEATGDRGNGWWSHRFRRKAMDRPVWEVCEVGQNPRNNTFGAFISNEMGKQKLISESRPYKGSIRDLLMPVQSKTKPDIVNVYDDFIKLLQKDGWEQVDFTDKIWTMKRFRRRIK